MHSNTLIVLECKVWTEGAYKLIHQCDECHGMCCPATGGSTQLMRMTVGQHKGITIKMTLRGILHLTIKISEYLLCARNCVRHNSHQDTHFASTKVIILWGRKSHMHKLSNQNILGCPMFISKVNS